MHTIKLLLTYYLNIGVQAANLSDCRIESNRNFFARIGMLYHVVSVSNANRRYINFNVIYSALHYAVH